VRGKLSRELERQKCVQDKRLRCSISRYGPSLLFLCPSLSLHPALFFLFSSLFRCRLRRKPRTVLRHGSISPIFPAYRIIALCTASASRVKLCAISLTFDNRSSSGNYISPSPNLLLHFVLALSLQTSAFLYSHLFALDGPSNVIRKKLKISSP